MKQNRRRKIIVDFEWHRISGEYVEQFGIAANEIIEFGAVMLDADNRELRQFKRYVKPRYVNRINGHVRKLTKITDAMLMDAPDFVDVLAEFADWCEKGRGNYDIYSWSDSDLIQIREEMALKDIVADKAVEYMLSNWFDLQDEFDVNLGFNRQVSLADALNTLGLDPVGQAHDALDDARNTAALYTFLSNPEKQKTTIATIREVLNPEPKGFTLGDMIDWSRFVVAG